MNLWGGGEWKLEKTVVNDYLSGFPGSSDVSTNSILLYVVLELMSKLEIRVPFCML